MDGLILVGLDDYPRSATPHPGELHVDLISWMGYYSHALQTMAEMMGKTEDAKKFSKQYTEILRGLDHHWSPQFNCFCDMTVNDEGGMTFFLWGLKRYFEPKNSII
jgi:mannosyl-oligosaccharide glucosidase